MAKQGFSMADLQMGAKKLEHVDAPPESKTSKEAARTINEAHEALEDLYNKHGGDIEMIFGELKQDPSKALKPHHRPKNSQEFAEKYLQGYYSVIPGSDDDHGVVDADARADSKSSHK